MEALSFHEGEEGDERWHKCVISDRQLAGSPQGQALELGGSSKRALTVRLGSSFQDARSKHVAESIIHRDAKVRDLEECVSQLEVEFNSNIEKLTLLCGATRSLIEENTDLTDEDLENEILELEILRGDLFEEVEEMAKTCPQCNASVLPGTDKCQFCGHAL